MKRYYVAMWTKRGFYSFGTNSLRLAKNRLLHKFARIVKVTDRRTCEIIFYKNKENGS